MKNNKETRALRRKIMKYFVLCCVGVIMLSSLFDGLLNLLGEAFYPELVNNEPELLTPETAAGSEDELIYLFRIILPFIFSSMALSFFCLLLGAFVFYKLTSKALHEESERRVKEQELIYAAVAHDLKTPMTSVLGFARALSEGRISAKEQPEIFDIIYRKSGTMNELVDTLYDYSKLGTAEYKPQSEPLDICSLIRGIVAEVYSDFEENGIDLEIDIPEDEIVISGDKRELRRAFTNLITNIYKHNPGGIKAGISVKERDGGGAVVTISDTGSAIPGDMDIFEPFVTENATRTTGLGSGLGLAITKRIIDRHGGEINLENDPSGTGKAFTVRL